jgi:hypothetical protein
MILSGFEEFLYLLLPTDGFPVGHESVTHPSAMKS